MKVKGYLYMVARNRCLNVLKRVRVDEHYLRELTLEPDFIFEVKWCGRKLICWYVRQ
ncbi:MAG: hypothetical protein V8S95_06615 [Odoribacter sp.]